MHLPLLVLETLMKPDEQRTEVKLPPSGLHKLVPPAAAEGEAGRGDGYGLVYSNSTNYDSPHTAPTNDYGLVGVFQLYQLRLPPHIPNQPSKECERHRGESNLVCRGIIPERMRID